MNLELATGVIQRAFAKGARLIAVDVFADFAAVQDEGALGLVDINRTI